MPPLPDLIRRWAWLMDSAFRVPGTRVRFGWDPLVGLVPGLGDSLTGAFACLLLVQAFRTRVPKVVVARMLVNIVIDLFVGVLPFVGDLFDFVWKSNAKNLRLLELYADPTRKPSVGDWIFVLSILAAVGFAVMLPIAVMYWTVKLLVGPLA